LQKMGTSKKREPRKGRNLHEKKKGNIQSRRAERKQPAKAAVERGKLELGKEAGTNANLKKFGSMLPSEKRRPKPHGKQCLLVGSE